MSSMKRRELSQALVAAIYPDNRLHWFHSWHVLDNLPLNFPQSALLDNPWSWKDKDIRYY